MRGAYRVELDEVMGDLARLARRAGQMMTDASTALWQADLRLAESVIYSCSEVTTALCPDLNHRCVRLLALQAPVATELRLVVAAMDAVGHLRRMGKLAGHIAKITRMKHPLVALPEDLEPVFARMAHLATTLAHDAASAMERPDPHWAEQLVSVEQEMATLHCQIFQRLGAKEWSHGVEQAVDAALVGRYYARFADHAAAIVRQGRFIVTGHHPSADTPWFPRKHSRPGGHREAEVDVVR
ncbi:MAG TPA: PhoU domain-containing protein [Pseudonocardiaceae bacterium]|jgi:phosphate transport system protein|nr:PhoU domain-containing protein [Pseudonocardiaceae bacterium]